MKNLTVRSTFALLLAAGGMACAGAASAAGPRYQSEGRGAATYREEVAVCGHIQQDRAACIREAGAARQAAAQGQLTGAPDYLQNALARCSLQPPMERSACEARVRGTGRTEIEGSVLGGGVIRETVTPIYPPARK
ncbi:hypothetical protein BH11PSE13_BH11PSE13_04170 [soil metagenome]